MPNTLGLILWIIGILAILISIYILNLIILKYLKTDKFKTHFYLSYLFMAIFILFRIFLFFYTRYLTNLNLPNTILSEKLLFVRIFSHIPFAITVSILLVICYNCLTEIKYKLTK